MELMAEDHLAEEWRWARVSGSCFLIAPDRVLTAAHSIGKTAQMLIERREFHVVFDFQAPPGRKQPAVMSKKRSVYTVTAIEPGGKYESPGTDWITLKLDRPATASSDRRPIRLAAEPLSAGREVYSLGHPKAISMRYARSRDLWRSAYADCYEAHLDAYDGVSGAPVFDAQTHLVVGMLIRSCPNREGQVLTYKNVFLSPLCYRDDRKCGAVIVSAAQFAHAA
jgi:V8-like Glu-specific endopeptidase